MKTTIRNSVRTVLLIPLVCFALAPLAQAVTPAPDGGYPGGNTAEGTQALFSLTAGVWNTALGFQALYHNTGGYSNTATGLRALFNNTTGIQNTANGVLALAGNTTGRYNTADGYQSLYRNADGDSNTAIGYRALYNNIGQTDILANFGSYNTAIGSSALYNNTSGSYNIALGYQAGFNLTTGYYNIDIGNAGIAGESSTIRIGTAGNQVRTFIAGIRGVTTGMANAVPVVIDSAGQLGTMSSSRHFKTDIKPMAESSEAILALKPVTFHYKSDATKTPQFGLIAEEVAQVDPNLVVRDADGEIYTVRYDAINAMLLNEFQKEHCKVEEIETEFHTTIAQQEREIQGLTARLDEQASQIQKVSSQLELKQPATQTVLTDR
jgi:hypothetical protein